MGSLFYVLYVYTLFSLLYKNKVYCKNQQYKGHDVIPCECFSLETECYNCSEYDDGDCLLNNFQLHKREGAAVNIRADAVGGDEERVFQHCYCPAYKDDEDERGRGADYLHLLQFEVAVPCKGHESVRYYKQ